MEAIVDDMLFGFGSFDIQVSFISIDVRLNRNRQIVTQQEFSLMVDMSRRHDRDGTYRTDHLDEKIDRYDVP